MLSPSKHGEGILNRLLTCFETAAERTRPPWGGRQLVLSPWFPAHPEEAPSVQAPSRRMRSWHDAGQLNGIRPSLNASELRTVLPNRHASRRPRKTLRHGARRMRLLRSGLLSVSGISSKSKGSPLTLRRRHLFRRRLEACDLGSPPPNSLAGRSAASLG